MKHLIKVTLLSLLFIVSINVFAQNYKFGHIDSSQLLAIMPEKEEAQKQIQDKAMEFDNGIKEMQTEYKTKVDAYLRDKDTFSETMRVTKEKELQDLNTRMQNFDTYAQQEIQKTQNDLFKPILDKAMKAIREVAEEGNFTYIFDTSSGVILYNSDDSEDIMSLVKIKLGLQ